MITNFESARYCLEDTIHFLEHDKRAANIVEDLRGSMRDIEGLIEQDEAALEGPEDGLTGWMLGEPIGPYDRMLAMKRQDGTLAAKRGAGK